MRKGTKAFLGGLSSLACLLTITNSVKYYEVKEMLDNGVPREAVVNGAIYYKNISYYTFDELANPNIRWPKVIKSGFDKIGQQWDVYDPETNLAVNLPLRYFGKELALMIN
ncbi:MAG: hypothetical protein Q8L34_02965 [Candidatus Woesearchaeota archaeon]|nr:hypothetical protein [Candidatus Woesearchaeota archaeon]